jgi:hypothetical protein
MTTVTVEIAQPSDADRYRLAQASRLIRFCRDQGVDPELAMRDKTLAVGLDSICDARGKIARELVDFG